MMGSGLMTTYNDLHEAAQYIINCMPSPYVLWTGGYVSDGDGPPAWGVNEPPPLMEEVRRRGAFCGWVANGMHRALGLKIPNPYGDERYDGGIVSYWDAYYKHSSWFDINTDYPDGTFLMSPYNSEAAGDQGHISMVWHYQGTAYVIEWIMNPGATWDYTVSQSNQWGQYQIAIPPAVWVPLGGGNYQENSKPTTGTKFTVDHLLSVYTENLSKEAAVAYFPHMVRAFKEFNISTRDRIAAFLGHAVGEVGEFTYWEEIGHGGGRFGEYWGRGPLQLTWQEAYQQATDYYQKYHPEDKVDFVADPDLVATPKYGFWTSAWYWRNGPNADLNPLADRGDFAAIIEAIFGAPYPSQYQLRWDYYNYAKKVLPADLMLDEGEPVPDPGKEKTYGGLWNELGYFTWADMKSWDLTYYNKDGKADSSTGPVVKPPKDEWHKAVQEVKYRKKDDGDYEILEEDGDSYIVDETAFRTYYKPVEEK